MGSNFGGDGGDTLTDPANGCNIAQEYVYLADPGHPELRRQRRLLGRRPEQGHLVQRRPARQRHRRGPLHRPARRRHEEQLHLGRRRPARVGADPRATPSAAAPSGPTPSTSARATPPPPSPPPAARCTRPGAAPATTRASPAASPSATPTAPAGTSSNLPVDGTVPNRYLGGLAVDPNELRPRRTSPSTASPGSGPRVRARASATSSSPRTAAPPGRTSRRTCPTCRPTRGRHCRTAAWRSRTDLGVVYRAPGRTTWQRVGRLPAVAVLQLKLGPDGRTLYAATHGRGIYTIKVRDCG